MHLEHNMKKIIFAIILIIIIFAVVFIISSSREKQIKEELNDNMTGSVKIDLIVVEKAKRILSIVETEDKFLCIVKITADMKFCVNLLMLFEEFIPDCSGFWNTDTLHR